MSRSNQLVIGFFVILIIAVGLYFWYRTAIPTQSEIDAATIKVEAINPNIFQDTTVQKISSMDTNGNLPLQIQPEDIGRDDPFSSY